MLKRLELMKHPEILASLEKLWVSVRAAKAFTSRLKIPQNPARKIHRSSTHPPPAAHLGTRSRCFQANTDPRDAIIDKDEYLVMHRKIVLAIDPTITPKQAQAQAKEDWVRDSEGKPGLDRKRFYWTWFEVRAHARTAAAAAPTTPATPATALRVRPAGRPVHKVPGAR